MDERAGREPRSGDRAEEWGYDTFSAYIPHSVHSPFYVYAYAFGDCLVNSLYAVFEQAESGFQEKYFALLEAGGTKHHKELLAPSDSTRPIRASGTWVSV